MIDEKFLEKTVENAVSFYAIDVAETESGDWVVIEINDGQMSGLSCNSPKDLYFNLFRAITESWPN
jgi:glutathione synthase/RimK-type ligase-like ATP-grasp enzyme